MSDTGFDTHTEGYDVDTLYADGNAVDLATARARRFADAPASAPGLDRLRPILVVAGNGAAGATTGALGLAGEAAAACPQGNPVAVDATCAGGDLAVRGSDSYESVATVQSWLNVGDAPEPTRIQQCCAVSSSGARLLGRDPSPLPWRASFGTVTDLLTGAGFTPVYDGGAPVWAPHLQPLLTDPRVQLVIAVSARAEAVNRLRPVLSWIDRVIGTDALDAAIVAVTDQFGAGTNEIDFLRTHLGDTVAAVAEIPYDPVLAAGEQVDWSRLRPDTRQAYAALLTVAVAR